MQSAYDAAVAVVTVSLTFAVVVGTIIIIVVVFVIAAIFVSAIAVVITHVTITYVGWLPGTYYRSCGAANARPSINQKEINNNLIKSGNLTQ